MYGWPRDLSASEVESRFLAAMEAAGVRPAAGQRFQPDGRKHAYRVHDDKAGEKSGEYLLDMHGYPAGCPGGWYHCWKVKHNQVYEKWSLAEGEGGVKLTPEERAAAMDAAKASAEERERRAELDRAKAIREARRRWEAATPPDCDEWFTRHPYAAAKKLKAFPGARRLGEDIILPYVNAAGEVMTVQTIAKDGSKKFWPGAPKRGHFVMLNPPKKRHEDGQAAGQPDNGGAERDYPRCWLCEGWATAVTVWALTGERVVAAGDAGNLAPVAEALRSARPEWELTIAPDWDRSHGNTGMSKAYALRDEYGLATVPPPFTELERGSDWNDLYCIRGYGAAKRALWDGLKAELSDPDYAMARKACIYPDVDKRGNPLMTARNLSALMRYLGVSARYDVISKDYTISGLDITTMCGDTKNAALDAYMTSQCAAHGLSHKTWGLYSPIVVSVNYYNPVAEWIQSVPWDGIPRIPELAETITVPTTYPYHLKETLITRWLISAVAAAFEPDGAACRGVLVLQGDQSLGKTSWLRNLIPRDKREWFGEGVALAADDRDSVKNAVSKWITELGELEGTFKKSELNKLKSFVTQSRDDLRLPYARVENHFPRRTVFAATINERNFLLDDTGNTRWWTVECRDITYNHGVDTQQVFAEAYEGLYLKGEPWHLTQREELDLEASNAEYRVGVPSVDLFSRRLDWKIDKRYWTYRTVTESLIECGLEHPQRGDVQMCAAFTRARTGQTARRASANGSRVYLLPPALPGKRAEGEVFDEDTR